MSALQQSDSVMHVYPFFPFLFFSVMIYQGFPDSSVSEARACNARDPGLVPGSGKIPWSRERLLHTHIICYYI